MLESYMHPQSWFVTLTYRPECLPPGGNLVPRDAQLWLKRLRKAAGRPLRFFLVGEYGTKSARPHYHAVIFGLEYPKLIEDTWPHGFVQVGPLQPGGAVYVAGYVTKKLTKPDAPGLNGRVPEFARMSLKPGIGAEAMEAIGRWYHTDVGSREFLVNGLPVSVRHEGKLWPIGRYLRGILREYITGQRDAWPFEKEIIQQAMAIEAKTLTSIGPGCMVNPDKERRREVTTLRAAHHFNVIKSKEII